jgi:hypothetical protein
MSLYPGSSIASMQAVGEIVVITKSNTQDYWALGLHRPSNILKGTK